MDLDEEEKKQVTELSERIGRSTIGKTQQVAIESITIALLNTLLGCGFSEEGGGVFLSNLIKDWKEGYPDTKKRLDDYLENEDKTSAQEKII
jgi:hypothetical protein